MIIEGAIAVKAALQNKKRETFKVYIDKDKKTKDFNYIRKLIRQNGVEVFECERSYLETILTGKSHGGIGADVSERREDEFDDSDIFFLDGIEDPFNLGYCLRTLYAMGVKNVLLNKRDYSQMEGQLLKSSAGAYDMINIALCQEPLKMIASLKEKGYYLYGLYRGEQAKDIFDVRFADKALFILGGEKRGISGDLLDLCDDHLYISYGSDFRNALNASAALDVVVTLLRSQRR
jgi:23S rRNA (guanosine2251-2'-O)-methyltransferase